MKPIKVLSLFNGGSFGRMALDIANVPIEKYYSSEIDKYADKFSKTVFHDNIDLGDITQLTNIDWSKEKIDLVIGGSPCQDLSQSKNGGLGLEGSKSKLFYEYARILKEIKATNPDVKFLLENVPMKGKNKKSKEIISEILECQPIELNSELVSAQNRLRLYWTNIPYLGPPENRNIFLKDISEDGLDYFGAAIRGRYLPNGKTYQKLEINEIRKANCLTTVKKDSLCIQIGLAENIKGFDQIKRIYSVEGKSPTINTGQGGHRYVKVATSDNEWRNLTPREYGRLQTVPEEILELVLNSGISNNQLYKIFGNGWTVEILAYIFKGLKPEFETNLDF